MSKQSSKQIRANAPIPEGVKMSMPAWAVWCALCSFAKWEVQSGVYVRSVPGKCIPRMSLLFERAHCSERTAQRALRELESLNLLRRESRYGAKHPKNESGKGEQTSNSYTLYPLGNAPKLTQNDRDNRPLSREELARLAAEAERHLRAGTLSAYVESMNGKGAEDG